ncbi:MAG TPA: LysM peptidoglycan-binding domain-containing M23 family metallopeptidase [Ktedonobacterales bacterium]|nr:LysM peptidoglycan-binding domain-containing M23 family metallopeptidase [Ktedonobacterales bacterium]
MSNSRPLRDFADDHRHDDESGYTGYSEALPAYTGEYGAARDEYGDSGYQSAYHEAGYSGEVSAQFPARDGTLGQGGLNGQGGALVPLGAGAALPAPIAEDATGPIVIAGTGVPMGNPFVKRRKRPLSLRIAAFTLLGAIMLTGLLTATPLASAADGANATPFQALAGAVVLHQQVGFFWYTAQSGDSLEGLAARFNVQVGGIYEMNNLLAGEELTIGKAYKIPQDPNYGADYRPASITKTTGSYGQTVFGSNWWNSYAGAPGPEAICGQNGNGNYQAYGFVSPDPGSYWVRGFSWYHDGVDMAAPQGNPIHAAQAGQVIWAGYDATNGFGWSVVINHCNHVSSLYGHMMSISVKAGENVDTGTVIGQEGSTGWSTGPHLHISVMWDNVPIDPMLFYSSVAAITGH